MGSKKINIPLAKDSRLTRLVNLDSLQDVCHFTELYTSVSGDDDVNIPTLLKALQTQEEFLRKTLSLAADDLPSSDIERQERENTLPKWV